MSLTQRVLDTKQTALRLITLIAGVAVMTSIAYAAWWAVWYRIPASPPKVVDRRPGKSGSPYCVSFCSALADNPHGFPGHCYVVWSIGPPAALPLGDSASFLTVRYLDQVPALWRSVPGRLISDAARGNMRNLDMLSVLVSAEDYMTTRSLCDQWRTGNFKVGVRDCVSFTNYMASHVGLRTPNPSYKFPQDYIRELKELNR